MLGENLKPLLPDLIAPSAAPEPRRRLLVLESGARLRYAAELDAFEHTLTLGQPSEERPWEFALRVLRRVALAERLGRTFEVAVLSASPSLDPDVLAARRFASLGLRAHGASSGKLTELIIVATPPCGAAVRAVLLELAAIPLNVAGGKAPPVRVRLPSRARTQYG